MRTSMWRRSWLRVRPFLQALLAGAITVVLVQPLVSGIHSAARQRETIDDMRRVGAAIFEFVSDEAGAAAAGASAFASDEHREWDPLDYEAGRITAGALEDLLAPAEPDPYRGIVRYIQFVPEKDGWGRSYHYFLNQDNLLSAQVTAIFSCGEPTRSGDCKRPIRTPKGKFPTECYSSDLVWADGTFIHYPTAAGDDGDLLRSRACDHGAG